MKKMHRGRRSSSGPWDSHRSGGLVMVLLRSRAVCSAADMAIGCRHAFVKRRRGVPAGGNGTERQGGRSRFPSTRHACPWSACSADATTGDAAIGAAVEHVPRKAAGVPVLMGSRSRAPRQDFRKRPFAGPCLPQVKDGRRLNGIVRVHRMKDRRADDRTFTGQHLQGGCAIKTGHSSGFGDHGGQLAGERSSDQSRPTDDSPSGRNAPFHHHAQPRRNCHPLRSFPDLPRLPSGSFGMFVVARLPSRWLRFIDRRVVQAARAEFLRSPCCEIPKSSVMSPLRNNLFEIRVHAVAELKGDKAITGHSSWPSPVRIQRWT